MLFGFKPVKPRKVIINGIEKEASSHKLRALRWFGLKPEDGRKSLSRLIDAEKSFNFRVYAYTP